MLEKVACYVCSETSSSPWAEENGFSAVRCRGCGLVYVSPRPPLAEISRAAQSGMHEGQATVDETGQRSARRVVNYRKVLRQLFEPSQLASLSGRRWLDLGCGFGELLEALALETGGKLSALGSEPNERKAAAARARGLDVTFRELAAETTRYDAISMLNVFSHLPDPTALLAEIRRLLLPGGFLVLQTGNWAELERSAIRDSLHLPDHLSFASEAIVSRVLEKTDFEVERALRFPMFRRPLWERLLGRKAAVAGGECDLWFRARRAG